MRAVLPHPVPCSCIVKNYGTSRALDGLAAFPSVWCHRSADGTTTSEAATTRESFAL